jgi:transcription antitermination factor NusG
MSSVVEYRGPRLNDPAATKNWFAVFTTSRHEKRVEEHFQVRGIESFLPLYRMRRQWKDRSKGIIQIPLFPNYIFVRIGRSGRIPVLEVPGVLFVVGDGRESMSVSESYIHFLREGLQQEKIEPYPYLAIGSNVRICSGMMAGMEGVLLRKKNDFRVILTLQMIRKSIKVEVGLHEIEPIGSVPPLSMLEVSEVA